MISTETIEMRLNEVGPCPNNDVTDVWHTIRRNVQATADIDPYFINAYWKMRQDAEGSVDAPGQPLSAMVDAIGPGPLSRVLATCVEVAARRGFLEPSEQSALALMHELSVAAFTEHVLAEAEELDS